MYPIEKLKHYLKGADKNFILKNLPQWHEEATQKFDCLTCAACCKNYSPRFKIPDIKRISKKLKLKESVFIDTYLRIDEDGDYVTQSSPCPFLAEDNYCTIYDFCPSDCKRFPYTNEDVIVKREKITLKNATFCPIVFEVLERITSPLPLSKNGEGKHNLL